MEKYRKEYYSSCEDGQVFVPLIRASRRRHHSGRCMGFFLASRGGWSYKRTGSMTNRVSVVRYVQLSALHSVTTAARERSEQRQSDAASDNSNTAHDGAADECIYTNVK